ncbi:PREDICTED: acyl-CoA-binding domain-containing protein 3 isoform X1 [Theobroma cacao]|uniref:Acyl-CoA-binding domain-containing protein 3 isoform X1 n=2 Tax=Theobroma cacao TaxID=3641 RepID=A0AB32WSL2_THECC|nr:PREDICTED: acyl-CoA-binding domain-containing protein 3 isoform X1 [Theobroma cacao]
MDLFLEFLFTISLSFILSFILAKLLSLSSVIDQHLEAVSRSCMEVTAKSEKYVLECEKGLGFVSEVVKVDALGDSADRKNTLEEASSGSHGSPKITGEPTEESYGQENFVKETTEIELAKDEEEKLEVLECEKENGGDCLKGGLSDEEDDDDDWERIERTELKKDFGAAVRFLECKSNADQTYDLKIANDVKMQFYGLHKIATEGPCHEPQPMALKLSARAKWNAWKRLGNMSPEAAMEQYITLLSRSIPGWMQDDICGESKQHYADNRACRKLPLDVNTMPENQTIAVDYRTLNEMKAHV